MAEAAGGTEIPDLKKIDVQLLIQDFAQARRDIYEERRSSEKRVSEERARSKWDMDRMRDDYQAKIKDFELGNKALINLLSRMQNEIDGLRQEKVLAEVIVGSSTPPEPSQPPQVQQAQKKGILDEEMTAKALPVPIVGPLPPSLGKPSHIQPEVKK